MKYYEVQIHLKDDLGNILEDTKIYCQIMELSVTSYSKIQKIAAVVNDLPFPIEFPIGVSADQ
jgi:hypothetical protein